MALPAYNPVHMRGPKQTSPCLNMGRTGLVNIRWTWLLIAFIATSGCTHLQHGVSAEDETRSAHFHPFGEDYSSAGRARSLIEGATPYDDRFP